MCFRALTIARSPGSCLNTRPQGRVIKRLPRDPANANIGLNRGFPCINICQGPEESVIIRGRRPRFSTFPEGPSNLNALENHV